MKTLTKRKVGGFTLLELMIVVAILGILAAIAFPSYRKYVLEVNRKAAIADMNSTGQALDRSYSNNNGAYPNPYTPTATQDHYAITVAVNNNNQSFTITATPDSKQSEDICGTLTLDSSGLFSTNSTGVSLSYCFR